MRYFFHVLDDRNIFDDEIGNVLSGPETARRAAIVIAGELARDGHNYRGFVVRAVDEEWHEIATVRVVVTREGTPEREPIDIGTSRTLSGR